jgi:hypothetical protein
MPKFEMADVDFDLQLFGEEGGGADGGGAEAAAGESGGSGEPLAGGAAPAGEEAAAGEKPGTILGGTEEEAAWDFSGLVPEGMAYDEGAASAFTAVAKEAGLTGEQAQKVAAYGMKYAQEGMNAVLRAWADQVGGWGNTAKTELGAAFDSTVQKAGTALEALEKVSPGIRRALDETGAGNRVELIRVFAAIGELVGEDNFRGFGAMAANQSSHYDKTDFSKY